jgi:hypothetical protein
MLVIALWLRGLIVPQFLRPRQQSLWLALSALTKPTNLAFVLLELSHLPGPKRRWRLPAMTVLPAVAVALLWSWCSGADTATWRMVEITGQDAAAFDPVVRMRRLFDNPLQFPTAVVAGIGWKEIGELWRQLIGVLGLFDTVLHPWVYPVLSALVATRFLTRLSLMRAARIQIAVAATATALGYVAAVYLVCYLTFTPLGADGVWGVQGRYFVPILPLAAIIIGAAVDWTPDERVMAASAVSAAVLAGGASVEAVLRADWGF